MGNYPEAYGQWAGNPQGMRPDLTRCCGEVYDNRRFHQCARKRGHGPNGDYCKQHDPVAVAERKRKADEAYANKYNASRYQWHGKTFFNVLKQIADGHNDPRTLARETIDAFEKGGR